MSYVTTSICEWESLFEIVAPVSDRSKGGLYALQL